MRGYRRVMGDMKGATMKAGQILSFVDTDGLIPSAQRDLFQSTLTGLQDDVPALAFEEVSDLIHTELGASPDKLFAFFSSEPVAAASIGQGALSPAGRRYRACGQGPIPGGRGRGAS